MRTTILILSLAALGGCASTMAASADQRADCARMAQTMGLQTTHDHQQTKGSGPSGMNQTHERCRSIQAAED